MEKVKFHWKHGLPDKKVS